jgi:hypothetical protein
MYTLPWPSKSEHSNKNKKWYGAPFNINVKYKFSIALKLLICYYRKIALK